MKQKISGTYDGTCYEIEPLPEEVAIGSTSGFIALWFRVIHKELFAMQAMVEAAKNQLTIGKLEYMRVHDSQKETHAQGILKRS